MWIIIFSIISFYCWKDIFYAFSYIKAFSAVIFSRHTDSCSGKYKNKTIAIYLSVYILSCLLDSERPEIRPFHYSYLSKHSAWLKVKLLLNTINNLLKIVPVFKDYTWKRNIQAIKQEEEKGAKNGWWSNGGCTLREHLKMTESCGL